MTLTKTIKETKVVPSITAFKDVAMLKYSRRPLVGLWSLSGVGSTKLDYPFTESVIRPKIKVHVGCKTIVYD